MKIEMTLTQLKNKIAEIRDEYRLQRDKYDRLMEYLRSIEEETRVKMEAYNEAKTLERKEWFNNLTDEELLEMCFDKKTKRVAHESGFLWWHKVYYVDEVYYKYNWRKCFDYDLWVCEYDRLGKDKPVRDCYEDCRRYLKNHYIFLKKERQLELTRLSEIRPPSFTRSFRDLEYKVDKFELNDVNSFLLEEKDVEALSSKCISWRETESLMRLAISETVETLATLQNKSEEEIRQFLAEI